jgi:hypothetical protein
MRAKKKNKTTGGPQRFNKKRGISYKRWYLEQRVKWAKKRILKAAQ